MALIENSDLHFVTNDTNTKSYTISQEQNVTFDDKTFHYIIASKNFFEYANYRIVDGKYPTNENEILAPKWYLFQLGLHPDNMIGSKITLKIPIQMNWKQKLYRDWLSIMNPALLLIITMLFSFFQTIM